MGDNIYPKTDKSLMSENNSNQLFSIVVAAFGKICDGGTNEEIKAAMNMLEQIRNQTQYINVLLNIISTLTLKPNIQTMSSIELKNRITRNPEKNLENYTEQKQNLTQSILKIFFGPIQIDNQISIHLSTTLSALLTDDETLFNGCLQLMDDHLSNQPNFTKNLNEKSAKILLLLKE